MSLGVFVTRDKTFIVCSFDGEEWLASKLALIKIKKKSFFFLFFLDHLLEEATA